MKSFKGFYVEAGRRHMVAGENMRSKEIRIFERYKTLTCFHILIRTTNRKEEVMI